MKYIAAFLFAVVFFAAGLHAQFRGTEPRPPSVSEKIASSSDQNLLFGFLNTDKFSMSHNLSMSYASMGSAGMGVTMYTNSMRYQISNPLSVQADVSVVYSPFSSLGNAFQKEIGGIYLNRAQVDYQPSKNFRVSLLGKVIGFSPRQVNSSMEP